MSQQLSCWARCKVVRPGNLVWPKIRLTASVTDLITILRCFLSFKTVTTSRDIVVFKIKFPEKNGHPSPCTLFSTASETRYRKSPSESVYAL
jgi:hypothetical protein